MLAWLSENLLDELVAMQLLRRVFGYREQPPRRLDPASCPPALFDGHRDTFLGTVPQPAMLHAGGPERLVREGVATRDFWFPSPVTTEFPANNRVPIRRWFHPEVPCERVIVGVDGIVQFGARWFHEFAKRLVPSGWDVVMMDSPFNHRRTPDGYQPGQLILGGNLAHQLSVSRQAILDLWTLVVTLQSAGLKVALVGLSYGAWLATNVSQLVDGLLFLHAITPPLDMGALLWEGKCILRALRRGLEGLALPREEVERVSRPISPWHFRPRLDPANVFLHAARYDRFVPTWRILQYAERIGSRPIVYPRGHISTTCGMAVMRETADRIGAQPP